MLQQSMLSSEATSCLFQHALSLLLFLCDERDQNRKKFDKIMESWLCLEFSME
jgi:hypothetical protein